MTRVLMPFPADAALASTMNQAMQARIAPVAWRHFPDGESLVTLEDSLAGADVAILASLRHADALALPLRFAARTAREFGARSVGLIAGSAPVDGSPSGWCSASRPSRSWCSRSVPCWA